MTDNQNQKQKTKYVFVTGGVVSGLGKGIVAASLGRLLKMRGLKVSSQKLDPYMNIDPGTMNPIEHGEVFVTEDGLEADLDLGHYERFIDENLTKYSNLTSGRVYWNVLTKERDGYYLGKTVQIIPHVTNEIKSFIARNAEETQADVMITEIGGTIGDIEGQPFLEAIRQFSYEAGRENCVFIHVCLVPYISGSDEYKSKPAQHSVKEMQSLGIRPDVIVTRTDEELDRKMLDKISMFCNVKPDCVINNITLDELYECPIYLHKQGLDDVVCRELSLKTQPIDLTEWQNMLWKIENRRGSVKIAMVGKYIKLHDAYISVVEALKHAGYENGVYVDIKWVDSEKLNSYDDIVNNLSDVDGILVPGGFGDRGIDGKILACQYARENDIPYLGICLGMQIAVIEFAKNVCGIKNATSKEFDKNGDCVIDLMPDQRNVKKGGTMRLGAYPCKIADGTIMKKAYNQDLIYERHRHRYEFNNDYKQTLENHGLKISGTSPDGKIVETVELPDNRFFIGVQFHPEFKSRPNKPHPLFVEFIKNSIERKKNER